MSLQVGDLKNIIAALMGNDITGAQLTPASFVINTEDLLLVALNNARRMAERQHSFKYSELNAGLIVQSNGGQLSTAFSSQTVTTPNTPAFLTVTGTGSAATLPSAACEYVELFNTTGAPITVDRGPATTTFTLPTGTFYTFHVMANANELRINATNGANVPCEVWGTGSVTTTTTIEVKEIRSIQLPDAAGNLFPIEFMTNEEYFDRIRRAIGRNPYNPAKTLAQMGVTWVNPVAYQHGQTIYLAPNTQFTFPTSIVMDCVQFMPDYANTTDQDYFCIYAPEYLQWRGLLEANKLFQQFVPRTEGNVDEQAITVLADAALAALIEWDDSINDSTNTPKKKPAPAPRAPAQPGGQ